MISLLKIEDQVINTFTPGKPAYYGPNGGVFAEPDYYGYNDAYTIRQLTEAQAKWPDNHYTVTVTVEFGPHATQNSKVMFLCYGTDSADKPTETAFSKGTMFVVPEYIVPIMGIGACFAAYGGYTKIKGRSKSQQ
jgi:hypothetical protein